jgi:hypothetical protein
MKIIRQSHVKEEERKEVIVRNNKEARLVAQGFLQVEGIDFNELFSPVVHFESV